MLQFSKKRILLYALILALCSTGLYGCNKDNAADKSADKPAQEENQDDNKPDASDNNADSPQNNSEETAPAQDNPAADTETPSQKPIAEKSPVEITRIEVDDPNPVATGAGELPGDAKNPHEHEKTPNLFEMGECQVEINGIYQVKLAKDLLKEINSRRKDYGIGPLTQNTSLLACADSRCKEQTYFVGHFRPDGTAFNSIAPDYVQGECIAVEYRTVKEIMEAWFSVNKSRVQLMNPDYTQCGISIYDIEGTYFIAAEFGY